MTGELLRLARRIRAECEELARVVDRVEEGWRRSEKSSDDLYLDSVALNLHGFYAGLERLFEIITAVVDGHVPGGESWHRALLEQVAVENPGVRPAVISEETHWLLDEYRGFRHVVRNVYTFRFDPEKLQKLVDGAPAACRQASEELHAFSDFLEERSTAG